MARLHRGQPPARHTKVVHHGPGCIKAGTNCGGLGCGNDVVSSKPACVGRDGTEAPQSGVTKCGGIRCKTCDFINVGSSFKSNVTGRDYNVASPCACLDCGTSNVIYLITCKKCGVQYVGKTSQTLRSRFNNHRTRLKQMCDLFLYNHFNSDGHCHTDILLMPIEKVCLEPGDRMTLAKKLSEREEYWYRELCSVYPYGLNDNVAGVGNVSHKLGQGVVIYTLFNKQPRKFRVRQTKRVRQKRSFMHIQNELERLIACYKGVSFSFKLRTYLLGLPKKCLTELMHVVERLLLQDIIPSRVALLVKDLIMYRRKLHGVREDSVKEDRKYKSSFLNIYFHNKGIEMINKPSILHNK